MTFSVYVDNEGWTRLSLPDLPWEVRVQIESEAGTPHVTGLHLERRRTLPFVEVDPETGKERQVASKVSLEEATITADRLRRLPLRLFKEHAFAVARGPSLEELRAVLDRERALRQPGQPWPQEHYRQVANAYREAVEFGKPPLPEIMRLWFVSRPMAAKYVRRARELGYLGWPTRPGVAGASETASPIRKRRRAPVQPRRRRR